MLPYLAQGANSSLEDGAVLGNLLAAVGGKDQLPEALRLYETLRKKRGEAIVRETFAQVSFTMPRNNTSVIDSRESEKGLPYGRRVGTTSERRAFPVSAW